MHAIEQQILDAAWARYEELKSQTKHELYHAMDDLLLGQVKVTGLFIIARNKRNLKTVFRNVA